MDEKTNQNEFLHNILDHIDDLICVVTPEFEINYVNKAFCRYFYVDCTSIVGLKLFDTQFLKEKIHIVNNNPEEIMKSFINEIPLEITITRDSRNHFFRLDSNSLPESKDKMIKWRDITLLKNTKRELNDSLIKYNTLSMFTSFASAVMDSRKRRFTAGNDQMLDLFGFAERDDFHNYDLLDLSPDYQPDGVLSSEKAKLMMEKAIKTGSNSFDWRHIRLDGTEFDTNVQLTAFGDRSEIMFCVFRPTKEVSRVELEKKQQELEKLVKLRTEQLNKTISILSANYEATINNQRTEAINQVLVGIAHEINTPLGICTTMGSFIEDKLMMFKSNYQGGTITKSQLEGFIEDSLDAITSVNKSIKIAADKFNLIKESLLLYPSEEDKVFHIKELIYLVIEAFDFDSATLERVFTISIIGDGVLYGNQSSFYRVIHELIKNALEHSALSTDELKISINFNTEDVYHVLTFINNGAGVDNEVKENIINPFYSTKKIEGKIGIGLSIISNVIKEMGGLIEIEDINEGFGITFKIPK